MDILDMVEMIEKIDAAERKSHTHEQLIAQLDIIRNQLRKRIDQTELLLIKQMKTAA